MASDGFSDAANDARLINDAEVLAQLSGRACRVLPGWRNGISARALGGTQHGRRQDAVRHDDVVQQC